VYFIRPGNAKVDIYKYSIKRFSCRAAHAYKISYVQNEMTPKLTSTRKRAVYRYQEKAD